jgi:DNA-binding transcriptional LysR family regulator
MLSRGRQLRYLVAIAEEGNITAAAKRLEVAQPTLSQAVFQLESELGVKLLERHSRGTRLTPAGVAFLIKARAAAAAEADAVETAAELARASHEGITIGFVGPPPAIARQELFAALACEHPRAQVSFRELPFPHGATLTWLAGVDAAICHCPATEDGVGVQSLCAEPRTLLAHSEHPLAGRRELTAAEALEERFVSYHADVQPGWAAFHSLDDQRGGPPRRTTEARARTPLEMLGIVSTAAGITSAPYADARLAEQTLPQIAAIPLVDAEPVSISLTWRQDNRNPLIGALVSAARDAGGVRGEGGEDGA